MSIVELLVLLFPSVRRLLAERNSYAEEIFTLKDTLAETVATKECLKVERDRIQLTVNELQLQVETTIKQVSTIPPQRLHVIGYARSGTTILMDILNSSSDVFIFSELNLHVLRKFPDLFSGYGGDDFVEHFTKRKEKELPLCYKGASSPIINHCFLTPDEYIDAVGQNYLYVGDKIATCNRMMDGVPDIDLLKEFIDEEERLSAVLIFTLRRPSENLLSVKQMFPDADLKLWGKSFAETMVAIVESFIKGKNSYLVFHEDIGGGLVSVLSDRLGMFLSISPNLVGKDYQSTRGQGILLEELWVVALDAIYSEIYNLYQCDAGPLKCSKTDGIVKKISKILKSMDNVCF